ncbi:MAG: flippase-like domain-containing protein [Chloroflexota bacterium]|nr:MAG: flippase-like domain-containing protein [Chloroflexota bacterium]
MAIRKSLVNSWKFLQDVLQNSRNRRILFVIVLLISIIFIAIAIRTNWTEFREQEIQVDYRYIIAAVLIYPAGMLPTAASWHMLLRTMGVILPFRTDLRIFSLSSLPRHIPGFVWYISSRSILYKEEDIPTTTTVTASAAEIILLALTGFLSTLMLFFSRIAISAEFEPVRTAAYIAVPIIMLLIISIPLVNRLLPFFLQRRGITEIPQIHQGRLIFTLLLMFIAWFGGGLILFVLAQSIYPMGWSMLPAMIGAWGAAGAISLTIGIGIQGLGIREITLGGLLSLLMPPILAIILAILFRLVLTAGEFLWVLLIIWLTRKPPSKLEGMASNS